MNIIKQDGSPVDETEETDPTPAEDIKSIVEDVEGAVKELRKGVKKFRNGIIFKIGLVAVALKVVDVAGKIIMENQRLKAKPQQDDEQ